MTTLPGDHFDAYHAHVYFDADSKAQAVELSERAEQQFTMALGRIHERPVGPHPCWSRQMAFDRAEYTELVRWLDSERDGLTIFVHALSGDDLLDHTTHAGWLGTPQALKLSIFDNNSSD